MPFMGRTALAEVWAKAKESFAPKSQMYSLASHAIVFDTSCTYANGTYSFTAHVWRSGSEITSTIPAASFSWVLNDSSGRSVKTASGVKTFTVAKSEIAYVGSVVGALDYDAG